MKKGLIFLMIFTLFYGCTKQNIPFLKKEKPVVTIGEEKYYKKDIVEFVYFEMPEIDLETLKDKDFKKEVIDSFIKHKLLLAEAKKAKISLDKKIIKDVYAKLNKGSQSKEPDEVAEKLMEERLITQKFISTKLKETIKISDDELMNYYKEFIKNKDNKTYYHIFQIVNEDKNKVEEAYRLIREGKKFEDIAKEFSSGPEAENGGDMGVVDIENFPPVFDNIKKMKKGELSKIITSEYGYHIFLLKDVVTSEVPSFDEVKDMLYNELIEAKKDQFLEEYLKEIKKNVKVEVNTDFDFNTDNGAVRPQ
jgi:parvulin-like peptidyl-prolyl isomerase